MGQLSTSSRQNRQQTFLQLSSTSTTRSNAIDTEEANKQEDKKSHFVVVGAGWAGWGAAKALCEAGCRVTILDGIPDPTGRTPFLSKSGKPVEAGTRGFWKDYPNINSLCRQLQLFDTPFTDFTNSSFYSPDGLEATAPVFSNAKFPQTDAPILSSLSGQSIPLLPSPLGQILATFPYFERLPLADRASMVGLLVATADCLGSGDEEVQRQYDKMTAHELFVRFGLSKRLVEDFVKPTLLVGLFKPPEELSALVVMELLYYYALAHVDSFDVRWIRKGTVADSLIAPLANYLESKYEIQIRGGCRVGKISCKKDALKNEQDFIVDSIEYTNSKMETENISNLTGVVLAVTAKGLRGIVEKSPDLARFDEFAVASTCPSIDVMSVRLWLDRRVPTRTPANVLSRFDELRGAGGTFFMLDQLQTENLHRLWGESEEAFDDKEKLGSVVACDFYNAGALLSLPDDDIVETLMNDLLPSAVPAFGSAKVVDSWIGRYPGAVSWFAPGTFNKRPPLSPQNPVNLKFAGDWVRMGTREHGAKGLCQERAYVSGLEAANALLREFCAGDRPHSVLPVREDELLFRAAAAANQQVMKFFPRFWVR